MSSIPQNKKNENEISDFVTKFMKEFQIGKLLFQCNAGKVKGIPVNHCLLSAADDKNPLCDATSFDGRSLAGKRRRLSRCKATDVMIDLIKTVRQSGLTAKYVLSDSWFSSPKTITALKQEVNLISI